MRRLHVAALAAFLLSAVVGAAHAAYLANCTFNVSGGNLAYVPTAHGFATTFTGTCGGGDVGCCVKIVADLIYSPNGSFWSHLSHHETTFTYPCGGIVRNGSQVDPVGTAAGFYNLTAKLETCAGVVIKDYGVLVHQQ